MNRRIGLAFALLAVGLAGVGSASSPWDALAQLRAALEAKSPMKARFLQTYLPAGFASGEEEEGTLAISLPECLRWDYSEPYPKSFLLCGDTAYYWNPEESTGQRYPIEEEPTPGLDFFLLGTEELRVRYNAAAEQQQDGTMWITLLPIRPSEEVVKALIHLDANHQNLLTLSYEDAEGNLTRFAITDYRRGAAASLFTPPAHIAWEVP